MLEVLQFIFGSPWRFLGVCFMIAIFTYWRPVQVNVMNGYFKEKDDEDKD